MYIHLETIQEQDICRCRWCELSLLPKAYFIRLYAVCLSVGMYMYYSISCFYSKDRRKHNSTSSPNLAIPHPKPLNPILEAQRLQPYLESSKPRFCSGLLVKPSVS